MVEDYLTKDIIKILLKDQTTKRNIIFATDSYALYGAAFTDEIPLDAVYSENDKISPLIKFRYEKDKATKSSRVKTKGEVFTPSWVCNSQNNMADEVYFNRKNVFNKEDLKKHTWATVGKKIEFPNNTTWTDYVKLNRMEITCGEAPYLVSRYDAVTGVKIPVKRRIGFLDRKLRIVSENTSTLAEWLLWSERAYKTIYGFEYQGDSIFLARKNLMLTYFEYFIEKFGGKEVKLLDIKNIENIATIITYNIFQMDGKTFSIPIKNQNKKIKKTMLFETGDEKREKKDRVKIMDWEANKLIYFDSLLSEDFKNGKYH